MSSILESEFEYQARKEAEKKAEVKVKNPEEDKKDGANTKRTTR